MAKFDKWDHRFIEMVNLVAQWSSCFQENRKIGAVIVKNKRVLTTGYNGAPANTLSCVEKGECLRRKLNIPSGTRHELCDAIHAELMILPAKFSPPAALSRSIISPKRSNKPMEKAACAVLPIAGRGVVLLPFFHQG